MRRALLCLWLAWGLQSWDAEAAQKNRNAAFRVGVDEVIVRVTVTDRSGRAVVGFGKEHFQLFEDSVEQQLSHFSNDQSEISVGIILDASGSMSDNILAARASIVHFLRQSEADDEYCLITFNERTTLIQDFTSSSDTVQNQVTFTNPKGRTALFDAVYLGLEQMKRAGNRKKALILITDGEDNSSRYSFGEVKRFVKESDTQLYAIGQSGELGYGTGLISDLVRLTGGRGFYPKSFSQLDYYIDIIHDELRSQYVLGYIPSNQDFDGKWRELDVKLRAPEGFPVKLAVRARDGYYARIH